MRVAIVGGSGYIGGELVRLLLDHPYVELVQASSNRLAGQPLHTAHPNLRGRTDLSFVRHDAIEPCDLLFLALHHAAVKDQADHWSRLAPRVIDLSADFRIHSPDAYVRYYDQEPPPPEWMARFTPGIPELYRGQIREASHLAMPGCMANAAILALHPLVAAGLISGEVVVDAKSGSSGSGAEPGPGSHHADRSGVMRVFRPVGHRHEAEIAQACGLPVRMTASSVEAVRGVQVVCHVHTTQPLMDRDVWQAYRRAYTNEPFVRIVKQRTGLYQLPEPKILAGSNYCDVGFALARDGEYLVAIAALDNLVKGGAGNAVQCMNIMMGWDETSGLRFPGLHPI